MENFSDIVSATISILQVTNKAYAKEKGIRGSHPFPNRFCTCEERFCEYAEGDE